MQNVIYFTQESEHTHILYNRAFCFHCIHHSKTTYYYSFISLCMDSKHRTHQNNESICVFQQSYLMMVQKRYESITNLSHTNKTKILCTITLLMLLTPSAINKVKDNTRHGDVCSRNQRYRFYQSAYVVRIFCLNGFMRNLQ